MAAYKDDEDDNNLLAHLEPLCMDCHTFAATWMPLPCRCLALCDRCVQIRKHDFVGKTYCPDCGAVNKGRFKHK